MTMINPVHPSAFRTTTSTRSTSDSTEHAHILQRESFIGSVPGPDLLLRVRPEMLQEQQKAFALKAALDILNGAGVKTDFGYVDDTAPPNAPITLTQMSEPLLPWMEQVSRLPGVQGLRLDGPDVHVTPTQDYRGRAFALLIRPEIDGYRVVVEGPKQPSEQRERMLYLRNLPGANSAVAPHSNPREGVTVTMLSANYEESKLYRDIFTDGEGLAFQIPYNSSNYRD